MHRAGDLVLRVLSVIVGGVLGTTAGVFVAILLVVGVYWLFTRDPSPESEVKKVVSAQGLGDVVTVEDCGYAEVDSVYDCYWCNLHVARNVEMIDSEGDSAMLARGVGIYCFDVPRSSQFPGDDRDEDAEFLRLVPEGRDY